MSGPTTAEEREARFNLLHDLTHDAPAAIMLTLIGDAIRIADDIADDEAGEGRGDRQEAMARLLHILWCDIPDNTFFDANRHILRPLLGSMVASWQVSNRIARNAVAPNELCFGYVMREAGEVLTMQVVALCRGWEHAADAYGVIFDAVPHHRTESLADWVDEVTEARD